MFTARVGAVSFAAITGFDLVALLLFLHVWLVGVGIAVSAEASSLPWSDRIELGPWSYALLMFLATVVVWLPFALGTYSIVLASSGRSGRLVLAALAVGLGSVWAGFYYLGGVLTTVRSFVAIRNTPVVDAGDVEPGRVQVSGTVRALEEPLEAPLSGAEAVCYDLSVTRPIYEVPEETRDRTPSAGSRALSTSFSRERLPVDDGRTRFVLEDDTGRVVVDPTEASVRLENETSTVAPDGERPSPSMLQYLVQETEYEPTDRREEYRETTLEPGDDVSVVGVARLEEEIDGGTDRGTTGGDADPRTADGGANRGTANSNARGENETGRNRSASAALPTITSGESFTAFVAAGCERAVDRRFRTTILGCAVAALALTGGGFAVLMLLAGHWFW